MVRDDADAPSASEIDDSFDPHEEVHTPVSISPALGMGLSFAYMAFVTLLVVVFQWPGLLASIILTMVLTFGILMFRGLAH